MNDRGKRSGSDWSDERFTFEAKLQFNFIEMRSRKGNINETTIWRGNVNPIVDVPSLVCLSW